ncbi:MAG: C39 family peptidase [Chloroflexota bacterium]
MPVPKVLLPTPHKTQASDSDCLAACAAMILEYLGIPVEYPQLLQTLNIKLYGAPASNIRSLASLGLSVTYSISDISGLFDLLGQGVPIIVFVRTGELPYWEANTDHAIVIVGYDIEKGELFLNDPFFENPAIAVPIGDFELAWSERDFYYATLQKPV